MPHDDSPATPGAPLLPHAHASPAASDQGSAAPPIPASPRACAHRPWPLRLVLVVVLAVAAVDLAGLLGTAPGVPVILLHDVAEARHGVGDFWTVTPAQARDILDLIARRGMKTLSLSQVEDLLAGRLDLALAHQAVVITVDDGPASTATFLAPELARRGLTAIVFDVTHWGPPEHLSPQQLAQLASRGLAVGSHGATHASLARAPGEAAQAFARRAGQELTESKAMLEKILGAPVIALAYPRGEYDAGTKTLASRAGYRLAFTTDLGYAAPGTDPMEIPRLQLGMDSTAQDVAAYLDEGRRVWYVRVLSSLFLVVCILVYLWQGVSRSGTVTAEV